MDAPPHAEEILIPLAMWSAIFELYLPRVGFFQSLVVSDHSDIVWYAVGALVASVVWQITYRDRPHAGGKALGASLPLPRQGRWKA